MPQACLETLASLKFGGVRGSAVLRAFPARLVHQDITSLPPGLSSPRPDPAGEMLRYGPREFLGRLAGTRRERQFEGARRGFVEAWATVTYGMREGRWPTVAASAGGETQRLLAWQLEHPGS